MPTPRPAPSPRPVRLLRLLLSGLVLGAALRGTGAAAGRPDAASCPGSLDCALRRRARCPPGAHMCGPCLQPFQEDLQGHCVPRAHRPLGAGTTRPPLEDEIDFLAQELAQREGGHAQPAATPALSDPGPPPTRGAPAPTPHRSLASTMGPVHMAPLGPRGLHSHALVLVLILACSVAGAAALVMAVLCWCRLQREIRLTQKVDYVAPQAASCPTDPSPSPGDQRLAHSAEVYHYQHQRQQMLCLQRHQEPPAGPDVATAASDEENEDGDFTVYECPGLAPTGEMEVRNPLFNHASLSTREPQ
ncbi:neural proliferation differentiation and control protein 1 [Sorex fumeus]|uniref:neural proliferation differentiation and control protein 1 n=1 Tax=Sorex fumeus TaxID=62283 RepID=UPI0024ACED01|nr:neural proliferation differentiation and control protein 1 [Sorex fumeus]